MAVNKDCPSCKYKRVDFTQEPCKYCSRNLGAYGVSLKYERANAGQKKKRR